MPGGAPSPRTRVRRAPKRGAYEREVVDAILDEALVCHLGFAVDGQPYVIPTLHARVGDVVYVHGSAASRALRRLGSGAPGCLTATLLDGVVLARSVFHHSLNYRSVVVLGAMRVVEGRDERLRALQAFTERLVPGRWDEVRAPSAKELKGTSILAMAVDEASAKLRTGPPVDDEDDIGLPVWAGVVPLATTALAPVPDEHVPAGTPAPEHVAEWRPSRDRR